MVTITTSDGNTADITQDWNDNSGPWATDTNAWDWGVALPIVYNMQLSDSSGSVPLTGHSLAFLSNEIQEYDWGPDPGGATDDDGNPIYDYTFNDYAYQASAGDVTDAPGYGDVTYAGPSGDSSGDYNGSITVSWDENAVITYVGTDIYDLSTYGSSGYQP
jgi:hypothetical protein